MEPSNVLVILVGNTAVKLMKKQQILTETTIYLEDTFTCLQVQNIKQHIVIFFKKSEKITNKH